MNSEQMLRRALDLIDRADPFGNDMAERIVEELDGGKDLPRALANAVELSYGLAWLLNFMVVSEISRAVDDKASDEELLRRSRELRHGALDILRNTVDKRAQLVVDRRFEEIVRGLHDNPPPD